MAPSIRPPPKTLYAIYSTALTPAGEYLLDQFAAYEQAIKRYAQQQLQQFFPIEEQEGEQT